MSDTPETNAEGVQVKGELQELPLTDDARKYEKQFREIAAAAKSFGWNGNTKLLRFIMGMNAKLEALREEVAEIVHDETGENSCDVVFIKSRFSELHGQIDDFRAEIERLKARTTELTESLVSAESREDAQKRQAHSNYADYREALAEVERLKAENVTLRNAQMCCESCDETVTVDKLRELRADKSRLDWLDDNALHIILTKKRRILLNSSLIARPAIDAAMKGPRP